MGLREWLMVFGGVIVLVIIADGIRRMRKASKDQHEFDQAAQEREAEIQRELPKGGARIVKTLDPEVFENDPIPVLRQVVSVSSDNADQASEVDSQNELYRPSFVEEYEQSLSQSEYSASENDLADDRQSVSNSQQEDQLEPEFDEPEQEEQPWRYKTQQELYEQAMHDQELHDQEQLEPEYAADPYFEASIDDVVPDDVAQPENLHEADEQVYISASALDLEIENDALARDSVVHEEADDTDELDAQAVSQAMAAAYAAEQKALQAQLEQEAKLARLQEEYEREQARLEQEQARQLAAEAKAQAELEAKAAAEAVDPVKAAAMRILGACVEKRPLVRKSLHDHYEPKALTRSAPRNQANAEPALTQPKPQIQAAPKPPTQAAPKPEAKVEVLREKPVKRQPLLSEEDERNQLAEASELLVLNVKCKDAEGFSGPRLLQVALACGMQYGEMQVFHRFLKTERGPHIQFSMLSSVNPGTFDMDNIDELSLPSVTFIMGLPAPGSSQECFTYMLETAKVIVKNLNGELRDEQRSVMTPQTIEHYRQRIQDFERKQLTRAR
ncbi:cell division protein ZipA [Oceanospirillum multiglobuliferum]|uniref:Cell division protein ZipA n=1 Tax=Oceanospirillum multiglobuliferum TaxID=64969 RepID=A0A1T4L6D1_9GAMM|nr:cell division protein ZipA [Oceanospirillum multiglobuliferum]OPX56778.1 cell division protein ZipA [Oceanospirillum multiglobuliferum]SJZ50244.1 cell division protein ZipA [Oceanospirillum multiglobuliferum]